MALSADAPHAHARERHQEYGFAPEYGRTPLLIIRFNQRKVYFEKPLYTAVSKAAAAKASVQFEIVLRIPPREAAAAKASKDLHAVLNVMNEMGVPENRITVKRVTDAQIEDDEVHLFVR